MLAGNKAPENDIFCSEAVIACATNGWLDNALLMQLTLMATVLDMVIPSRTAFQASPISQTWAKLIMPLSIIT
ncbi:MAG: hypothetical protein B6I19_06330 [Bacteroidetes bacterium 4572_114]|nr:MAG: hypothetical protein B6I19_06330 [Bacteroidetes bacterium 4572_114]